MNVTKIGLNRYFVEIIPHCNRRYAFNLYCDILCALRREDLDGTECIHDFIETMQQERKKYKAGANIDKDKNGRFVGREPCKPLTDCSKAMQAYLFAGKNFRTDHFLSLRKAFEEECSKKTGGSFRELRYQTELLDKMLLKQDEIGLDAYTVNELRSMKHTASALTWIMILLSVTPQTAAQFIPTISSVKSVFMRELEAFARASSCNTELLKEKMIQYVNSDCLSVPNEHFPQGETLLMLLWRWAQECIDVNEDFQFAQTVSRKGILYAETFTNGAISTAIYPYVMCLYVIESRCCGHYSDLVRQEEALRKAAALEARQRRRVEKPDYHKIDNIPVISYLRKREALFWSRYRNIDRCQESYFQALSALEDRENYESVRLEITKIYNNLAVSFRKEFDLDNAQEWYLLALKTREEFKDEYPNMIALAKTNLAVTQMLCQDFQASNKTLSQALKIRSELKSESQKYQKGFARSTINNCALITSSMLCGKPICVNWIPECTKLLSEAREVLATYDQQQMSEAIQTLQFNYWVSEAVFLFAGGLMRTTQIEFLKKNVDILQKLEPEINNEHIPNDIVLYYAANRRFSDALNWLNGRDKNEWCKPDGSEVPYYLRRYGIFILKCTAGTAITADLIRKPAAETHALFRKALETMRLLLSDISIRADYTAVVLIAFYSVFLMRNPAEADLNGILPELERAEKIIAALSQNGEHTYRAIQPLQKQILDAKEFFSQCDTPANLKATSPDMRKMPLHLLTFM